MKRIIAIGASNSKKSINKLFATYAANQVSAAEVEVLDLNDFPLPMYGIDHELTEGIPPNAQKFLDHINGADGIVISFAEHNGAYSAVFKNLFDWMSRINKDVWAHKPMLLMATSPGGRGGKSVLGLAADTFPHLGGNIVAQFSLPAFGSNFGDEGITDADLANEFSLQLQSFKAALNP